MAISMWMIILEGVVVVGMIAVDDMRRHEHVKKSGDDLDADEATHKAGNENEAGGLVRDATLLKVAFGLGQHAIQ